MLLQGVKHWHRAGTVTSWRLVVTMRLPGNQYLYYQICRITYKSKLDKSHPLGDLVIMKQTLLNLRIVKPCLTFFFCGIQMFFSNLYGQEKQSVLDSLSSYLVYLANNILHTEPSVTYLYSNTMYLSTYLVIQNQHRAWLAPGQTLE